LKKLIANKKISFKMKSMVIHKFFLATIIKCKCNSNATIEIATWRSSIGGEMVFSW
jgi:hypothetical protein